MTAYNFSQVLPDSKHPPRYEPGMEYTIDFEYALTGALVEADTITTPTGAMPSNGIRIVETEVIYPELDSNATPTGTFDVGDSGDTDRFIDGVPLGVAGVTTAGFQLRQGINRAQTLSSGNVSIGYGYLYGQGTDPRFIVTVGSAVATGETTGLIRLRVTFLCTGENPN